MQVSSGKVVWYVVGRFYTDANEYAFDAGFFPFIDDLPGPFFKGDNPGESNAHFTFYADKFTGVPIQNGDVTATLFPVGSWDMYLIDSPSGDWDKPSSFKGTEREKIGTFARTTTTMSTTIGTTTSPNTTLDLTASLSLLTFELKESWDFEWKGKIYNLKNMFSGSVTQLGFTSPSTLTPLPQYPSIKAFTASAMKNSN